jgi:acetylornithine deacetylase/succinyl-diaminopimelate desuccinylase-like protein
VEVDTRSTRPAVLAQFEREIRAISEACAREENERRSHGAAALTYLVERIGDRPCGATSDDEPLVQSALESTRLVGRDPELAAASTDASAAIDAGAPAIAIGAGGRGGDAHSTHEWFDPSESAAGAERALTIVATMARLAAD